MEAAVSLQVINPKTLQYAFQQGAERLILDKQYLNKINVFPVADGDTGSNLASLMQSILEETREEFSQAVDVFEKVASASLIGARGNSGIIFAQYFNGLYNYLSKNEKGNSVDSFVDGVNAALQEAYQAIEKPVEGTIISVIRSWANTLKTNFHPEASFEALLQQGLISAKKELENTPKQLKILQKNKVVDAGAQGFYLFLEGFTQAFSKEGMFEQTPVKQASSIEAFSLAGHQEVEKPIYRYCTEVLLEEVDCSQEEIKEELSALGDSLIVTVSQGKARIHIHSNEPEKVLALLGQRGTILQQKADDMLLQYEISQHQQSKVALVTDSIADIPFDYLLENQIHVLPMNILIGKTSYIDKITLSSQQFFDRSYQEKPTFSQPTIQAIEHLFSYLETRYSQILVITVAKKLSGTHHTIKEAANKKRTCEIAVIDSKKNSAAEGLLVMKANEWIKEGLPFNEIVEKVKKLRSKTDILVNVDSLTPMIESGRIPQALGKMAQQLNIKPIVGLDNEGNGKLTNFSLSKQSGEKKIIRTLFKKHQQHKISTYAVIHAQAKEQAELFAQAIEEKLGFSPAYIMDISTVVALSAGKGSVAVAYSFSEEGEG